MRKKTKTHMRKKSFFLYSFILLCSINLIWAMDYALAQDAYSTPAVVETEISLDQIFAEDDLKLQETPDAQAGQQEKAEGTIDLTFDEQQIMMINKSLKNMIEENSGLSEEKESLVTELKQLRGQSAIRSNRVDALTRQRDNLKERIGELEKLQKEYDGQIKEWEALLEERENEFQAALADIEEKKKQEELKQAEDIRKILPALKDKRVRSESEKRRKTLRTKAKRTLRKVEAAAQKTAHKMNKLAQKNKELIEDSAKVHYNLGNLFFGQSKYKRAAIEYKKVIELMPYDAAAHYNLAFVCGEFLDDQETALDHYQQYLYLESDAEDVYLVREKILEAQLAIKARIVSPIDRHERIE